MQRLDRILSEAGVASRKELRAIIRAGRVTADGAVVTDESRKFDEAAVHIAVDGQPVRLRGPVLIMLHKPAGYLTAADDPKAKTDHGLRPGGIPESSASCPVGRLDKDTEGLLLLTNDGDLAHRILSPRHGVWKRYYAEHEGTDRAGGCPRRSRQGPRRWPTACTACRRSSRRSARRALHRLRCRRKVPPGAPDARQQGPVR
ncbi:MAG: pseudouridine synthase [Acutalibacteraceae bacterium]